MGVLSDVAAAVSQLAEALADWVKAQISTLFSAVVNPIISGLQSWANNIEYHMTQFFSELAKWDTLDGDESVSATMNAGSAFMLSFMGQQDKAEQITDVLMYVMNFIRPFEKYLNPMDAMTVIAEALGGTIPAVGNFFDMVENAIGDGVSTIVETFMGIAESIAGNTPLPDEFDMELPTMEGVQNFLSAAGISNELIDGVIDGVSSYIGENVDSMLSVIGLFLTVVSIGYTWMMGGMTNLFLGGISALLESITFIGGMTGELSLPLQFMLGTFGCAAGISSVILSIKKWAIEGSFNKVELLLVGSNFGLDFATVAILDYRLNQEN